uniref:Uncharacterized protein n=1 Tax=Panagrolaimus superbus TaxID=310955 RepID=A0A914YAX7_9BILA
MPLGIYLAESYEFAIPEIIDPNYRAKFIQDICKIASGDKDFVEVFDRNLKEIWKNFKKFANNFDPSKIDFDKFESCFEARFPGKNITSETDGFWD